MDRQGTVTLPSGEVAQWRVSKHVLYVRHGAVERSSELGGFGLYPEALATILLAEMVMDTREAPRRTH